MKAMHVRALIHELIDENPFAIRAVLKILSVEFTTAVPTLAVTNEARPRLLVNLEFMQAQCRTDEHVKALLCHEFLHVLLRHTDEPGRPTPARHLAVDAVINAIIHRQLGEKYSSLMSNYYGDAKGLLPLLRPMTYEEAQQYRAGSSSSLYPQVPHWWKAWHGLYQGKLLADDIEQLAKDLSAASLPGLDDLLGNHDDDEPLSDALAVRSGSRPQGNERRRHLAKPGPRRSLLHAAGGATASCTRRLGGEDFGGTPPAPAARAGRAEGADAGRRASARAFHRGPPCIPACVLVAVSARSGVERDGATS